MPPVCYGLNACAPTTYPLQFAYCSPNHWLLLWGGGGLLRLVRLRWDHECGAAITGSLSLKRSHSNHTLRRDTSAFSFGTYWTKAIWAQQEGIYLSIYKSGTGLSPRTKQIHLHLDLSKTMRNKLSAVWASLWYLLEEPELSKTKSIISFNPHMQYLIMRQKQFSLSEHTLLTHDRFWAFWLHSLSSWLHDIQYYWFHL